jgi:hypothetical protein
MNADQALDILAALVPDVVVTHMMKAGKPIIKDYLREEMKAHDTVAFRQCEYGKPSTTHMVTLNRHIESTFTIPDVSRIAARPDLAKIYAESAAIAIGLRIAKDIRESAHEKPILITRRHAPIHQEQDVSERYIETDGFGMRISAKLFPDGRLMCTADVLYGISG